MEAKRVCESVQTNLLGNSAWDFFGLVFGPDTFLGFVGSLGVFLGFEFAPIRSLIPASLEILNTPWEQITKKRYHFSL